MFMMSGSGNSQDKLLALIKDERALHDKIRRLREAKEQDLRRVEQRYDNDIKRNEQSVLNMRRDIERLEQEIARNNKN